MTRSPVRPPCRPPRRRRTAAAAVVALLAATTLGGCGGGDTDPTEEALQRTLDDLGVETDGTLAQPAQPAPTADAQSDDEVETTYGRLAEDFPEVVPVIDGRVDLTVRTGARGTPGSPAAAGATWLVAVRTTYDDRGDLRTATDEAAELLRDAGWRRTDGPPGRTGRTALDDGTWTVTLTPEWTGEGVALTYAVAPSDGTD